MCLCLWILWIYKGIHEDTHRNISPRATPTVVQRVAGAFLDPPLFLPFYRAPSFLLRFLSSFDYRKRWNFPLVCSYTRRTRCSLSLSLSFPLVFSPLFLFPFRWSCSRYSSSSCLLLRSQNLEGFSLIFFLQSSVFFPLTKKKNRSLRPIFKLNFYLHSYPSYFLAFEGNGNNKTSRLSSLVSPAPGGDTSLTKRAHVHPRNRHAITIRMKIIIEQFFIQFQTDTKTHQL